MLAISRLRTQRAPNRQLPCGVKHRLCSASAKRTFMPPESFEARNDFVSRFSIRWAGKQIKRDRQSALRSVVTTLLRAGSVSDGNEPSLTLPARNNVVTTDRKAL